MSTDEQNPAEFDPQELHADLVAYLDGELDTVASQHVEDLLATDASVRGELHKFSQSWELLDELPRVDVGESFTRSTVEMAAVAAGHDVEQDAAREPLRQRLRSLLFWGVAAVGSAAGFIGALTLFPDKNERLLRDLPVIQNVDEYLNVDKIEFLERLRDEGVFSAEGDNG